MAHIKDDTDTSVAKDSVFDWGDSSVSLNYEADNKKTMAKQDSGGPSSRYDPKAMSRIVDITDLVDDSDDADSDFEGDSGNISAMNVKKRRSSTQGGYKSPLLCRQALMLAALTAIIVGASLAVGYAVLSAPQEEAPTSMGGGGTQGSRQQMEQFGQVLLEAAEEVTEACSESDMGLLADIESCKELCEDKMCCFEGVGGCAEEGDMECAVYGACVVLTEGSMNAPNGDEPAVYEETMLPTNPPEEDEFDGSPDEEEWE